MDRLARRKALVIGAATGIGRAVAILFAREGADVAVADLRDGAELEMLSQEIGALGRQSVALQVDVRIEQSVAGTIERAISAFGHLDVLVNNAGISGPFSPLHQQETADWRDVMAVNFDGVVFGMRHVLPHMLARRSGRIINTASQLAHKPASGNAIYCASKAAVVALTASVAMEVAAEGVIVNAVCPGPTDTPMWRKADGDWNAWKISTLPIRRIGTPEEIAWAYVFLASDESSYMIGQSISPNGGDVVW